MQQINPLLVKELQSRMRNKRTFWFLTGYLSILALFTLMIYWLSISRNASSSYPESVGRALFIAIAVIALIETTIIAPGLTANSINGEKQRQSFDLLLSSLLTPWQIVLGKLFAALSFAALLILIILPFLSVSFLFGGVALAEVIIAILGIFSSMLLCASLGLYCSTRFNSTTGSLSASLGILIFYLLLIPFVLLLINGFGTNIKSEIGVWLFTYTIGFFMSIHPFIALGYSALILETNNSYWYNSITINQIQVMVPSPWIALVVLSLLISWLLCYLSARRIQRERYKTTS
jgi:ABC-2 type transport system permease protein